MKKNQYLQFCNDEQDIERLKNYIVAGDVLLFFGAGYSKDATNIKGGNLPLSDDLSKEIGSYLYQYLRSQGVEDDSILELKDSKDLKKTSNLFMKIVPSKLDLVEILKKNFTIKNIKDYQKNVLNIKWRKIYTTNYDDLIEKSLSSLGKTYTTVNCDDMPYDYRDCNNMCFHINGDIIKIKESDLDSKIKLSQSSYFDSNQFSNTPWYREFKKDVFNARCIIFVGYSLYDIDIRKILIENTEYLVSKTFFITRKESKLIDSAELSDYGSVLAIGVDGLSDIIDAANNIIDKQRCNSYEIKKLDLYQPKEIDIDNIEIDENEVYSSLLYGVNENSFFDRAASSIIYDADTKVTKFINRKEVNDVISKIKNGFDVLVVSDLGNGKSFILKLVRSILSLDGYSCYGINGCDGNLSLDLDEINKKNKNIIFIDDYFYKIDSLKLILQKSLENIQVVLASRSYEYEQSRLLLGDVDIDNLYSFNINRLTENDLFEFDKIISYLGLWKEKAGFKLQGKLKDIDYNSRDKLSSLLLHVLKSKNIKDKLNAILDGLGKNKENYDTIFSLLLLSILGYKCPPKNIVSDVAMNNRIYEGGFLNDSLVNTIINIKNNNIEDISSSLAKYIIQECYNKVYVKEKLLDIIEFLNKIYMDTKELEIKEITKKILRFSSLERMLPNKRNEIKDFYKKAKERLPFLQHNPHFWVQYAMASIPFKEYNVAEDYLETALGLANSITDYHTRDIDTQRGRLYLLFCIDDESAGFKKSKSNFEYFKLANEIFSRVKYEHQKLRPLINYKKVYDIRFNEFKKGEKVYFEHAVNKISRDIQDDDLFMDDFGRIDYKYVSSARKVFEEIQDNIVANRKIN
ncbi:SIR2 family protein [Morganella morganii]